jgi:hypothetical protein
MNNPQVRAYAHSFAAQLLPLAEKNRAEKDWSAAIARGYEQAIGRPPSTEELQATTEFLQAQEKLYSQDNKPKPRELALTDFCQVLFGLNEFVYIE